MLYNVCEEQLKEFYEKIIKPAYNEKIITGNNYGGFVLNDIDETYRILPSNKKIRICNKVNTPYDALLPKADLTGKNPLGLTCLDVDAYMEYYKTLCEYLNDIRLEIEEKRQDKAISEGTCDLCEEDEVYEDPKFYRIKQMVGEDVASCLSDIEYSDYRLAGNMWGEGAYGTVCLAYDKNNKLVALKKIKYSDSASTRELKAIIRYINIFNNNPNLIKIYDVAIDFFDATDSLQIPFLFYTMEVADNLHEHIAEHINHGFRTPSYKPCMLSQNISALDMLKILEQLLKGVKALHDKGYVHRDIKPENIIFVDGIPKLADLGLITSCKKTMSLVGTPGFLPKEYLEKFVPPDQRMDLYALGMTAYCCFTGLSPDKFPNVPFELRQTPEGHKINDIITKACEHNSEDRFQTADEFIAALKI